MIVVALLWAAASLGFALRLARRRLAAPRLPPPIAAPPATTVLLPLRDEIANLDACLAALRALRPAPPIVAIDDDSRDGTLEAARALAATHSALMVVAAPPPPPGANGKVNALLAGARAAERSGSAWLLAVDADARPAPAALARAHAAAAAHGLDALSLAGRQAAPSLGEALLTPPVFALLDALLPDWAAAARGEGPPVANGQFFLVRRAALEAIGGYGAILGERLDDVALARRLAAAGLRVGFWRARDALAVRMYRGLAATFRGWRRNLALIFAERPAIAHAVAALAILSAVLLEIAAARGAVAALATIWGAGVLASGIVRASAGNSPLGGLLFPLDLLALAITVNLAGRDARRGRLSPWRGRPLASGAGAGAQPGERGNGAA
ncbi:MAG: glycosyltransferase [Thermoanaerobaculia bacterium]